MFCPNCGEKLNGTETFCSNCGNKIELNNNINVQQTMSEKLSKQSSAFFGPKIKKIKHFVFKFKKQLIIGFSVCFVIILGVTLFNKFYDFTKLSWDKENGDYDVTHTDAKELVLNVLAYDKEKQPITDIKFEVDNGEIVANGANVTWVLPEEEGKYKITAVAPSGKKISKSVEVINFEETEILDGLYVEEVNDEVDDNDGDGITNAEETKKGTNPNLADTDKDGLIDSYEFDESKTDPLKNDTDGDGIFDGYELSIGLDPLKIDSMNDGINDGDRSLNFNLNNEEYGVTVEITGKGNIASSVIDVFDNPTFADTEGLLGKVYNFYTDGILESATVKIKYDINEIQNKGLNEDDLTLYYFNEETLGLEAIETIIDKENKVLTVILNHFSKYVVGAKGVVVENKETDILFVIDNSVSMYTMQQMTDAGYGGSTGAVGNDALFERIYNSKLLIDLFKNKRNFGVAEFSGDYVKLQDFTNDKSKAKSALDSMRGYWHSDASGTNIISALNNGINEFTNTSTNHYLILFTDGKNTEGDLSYNKDSIISNAQAKNVEICIIGLGNDVDEEELREISQATGCDYYPVNDSDKINQMYQELAADLNYNYVDVDGDQVNDGMIIADSGFIVTRDGFSFKNFGSVKTDGHCYGMAAFAMLYYTGQLKVSLGELDEGGNFDSFGYDLNGTYFEESNKYLKNSLYDFKFSSKFLDVLFYGGAHAIRGYINGDKVYAYKPEYYELFIDAGMEINDKKGNSGLPTGVNKYQNAVLNIESEKFKNSTTNDEYQLFQAIWRLHILQRSDIENDLDNSDLNFELLKNKLENGIPMIISMKKIGGGHAVNATKIIQDINNSNKFWIEIYDSNYPGQNRYIEITRTNLSFDFWNATTWSNDYEYEFEYGNYEWLAVDDLILK